MIELAALALAVWAVYRLRKTEELPARVERLERELAALRTQLRAGGVAAGTEAEPTAEAAVAPAASVPGDAAPPALPDAAEASAPLGPATPAPEIEPVATPPPGAPIEPPAVESSPPPAGDGVPPPPPPTGPSLADIDWERWLGVRGAAVLGGAVLALAGLYFFRYSIEHGLIPPWLRVVIGTLVGIGSLAGAEWSVRRRYAGTANALAGGGLVILYAAFWAAHTLYGLIGAGTVFLLLIAVTVTGAALSWRHDSLVIAVIGLVGGFLTPFFASSGSDRPIGLFGYLLLLDVGILTLARRKNWPVLALLAVTATALYQALWIGARMGPERTLLGLAILAVFALVFAAAAPRERGEREGYWRWSQTVGVLLPFVFVLYFAGSTRLDTGIVPLGGLLIVLGVAAGWLARQHDEWALALGAAGATVAVMLAWLMEHSRLGGTPWTTVGVMAALAAAHHVNVERTPPPAARRAAGAASTVALGLLVLLVVCAVAHRVPYWPVLVGLLALAAPLVRQGMVPGHGAAQVAGAIALAGGLAGYRLAHGTGAEPGWATTLVVWLGVAVAWQALAVAQARRPWHRAAEHAAAALALVLLLARLEAGTHAVLDGLGTPLVFGVLVLLAATRLGGGIWMAVAVAATALVQTAWTMDVHPLASAGATALAWASAAVFVAWPLVAAGRLRDDAWSWRAAALAGLAWMPAVGTLFEDTVGEGWNGFVPLALGALEVAAAARARTLWPADDPRRTRALAWLCGTALALLTVAIPLQVEKQWITIGWALEGAALIMLWTRLDHPGLKYTGLALLVAVVVRLVANEEVLVYYERGGWRIVNWIAYTYLVPAAALAWAARLLEPLEVPRLRTWEERWYPRPVAIGAGVAGLGALAVVFVWLNLAIADWFSTGPTLQLAVDRMPARDLTTSIAWAGYAILLLALGVRLGNVALRWVSLGLMMVTIGKVFLYDLGELGDLYRVASLLGLAISLLVVSVAYQRFVLRPPPSEDA